MENNITSLLYTEWTNQTYLDFGDLSKAQDDDVASNVLGASVFH